MYRVEVPERMNTLHEFQRSGGSIAAVFPIHYPRELLRAFNFLPVEVWGPPGISSNHGEAHLQPYICSVVRNALSFIQSGGLDVVDLLLLPHTCDSLQGLGSLLIDFVPPRQPVLTLYLPRGQREADLNFLVDEIRILYHRLEVITGRSPSDDVLMAFIHLEEEADNLLSRLHQQHSNIPLDDEPFYHLIRSREYLPAERFKAIAQETLSQSGKTERGGIPVLISGIVPEPMSLFKSLSEMGARVVADDLACCGRRLYPAGRSENPFQRMAERIVRAPSDSTRGSPIPERLSQLLRLVNISGARGVIFYEVKFCEPELFDLPNLRHGLLDAGIPSLTVEVDIGEGLSQPILNRLAAFIEMIQ